MTEFKIGDKVKTLNPLSDSIIEFVIEKIVEENGQKVAIYHDEEGKDHAFLLDLLTLVEPSKELTETESKIIKDDALDVAISKGPHRFKKGEVNNPAGRPKGSGIGVNLTTLLKKRLLEVPKGHTKAYAELFIDSILYQAFVLNDQKAMRLIFNYVDGLPRQTIGLDGGEGLPIQVSSESMEQIKIALTKYLENNK